MPTAHPDEGTIHAWLDGALDDAESSRIAAHVAGCADCAAATAEARGLIAGAARVVRALDQNDPRAGLVPSTEGSLWRTLRVTPARAAIAATLLVVAGLTLTRDWAAHERFTPATAVRRAPASVAEAAARDPLLDSAIRRNVAQASPPRAVQRAPGVDLPQPEAPASAMSTDRSAPARVAEGRAAARVVAESAPVAADAASAAAVSSSSVSGSAVASRAAPMAMKAMGGTSMRPSRECLLVDRATPGASWPGVALPWLVTLDAGGAARVQPGNDAAPLEGTWRRTGDSTAVQLADGQRFSLGAGVGERRGTLASPAASVSVVVRPASCRTGR